MSSLSNNVIYDVSFNITFNYNNRIKFICVQNSKFKDQMRSSFSYIIYKPVRVGDKTNDIQMNCVYSDFIAVLT
jgi:hypothetical protein